MKLRLVIFSFFILFLYQFTSGQVRIRIFANQNPESAIFSVTRGEYQIDPFNGESINAGEGTLILISKMGNKLALKVKDQKGFVCDSIHFTGKTGNDFFSLRINGKNPVRQFYSDDLHCVPDMGALLFINVADIETYIAGVVKAEGGSGKNMEYFKTQAILTRTYLYKHFYKHIADKYNLCDNTHCQVFNGITGDSLIAHAAGETSGMVLVGPDTSLIISAYHSNCGGETAASEDVWLSSQPYLKKVTDPYCLASRNAEWKASISIDKWTDYLRKNGYTGKTDDAGLLNFSQTRRMNDYKVGDFTLPLKQIRDDFNLKSTFFSLFAGGDSVILRGRGYGHGVGLCQEGAMVMASRGYNYGQIIDFYFTGVKIMNINTLLPGGE